MGSKPAHPKKIFDSQPESQCDKSEVKIDRCLRGSNPRLPTRVAVSPLGQKAPGYFSVFNVRSTTKVVMRAKHKSPSHR